MTPPHMTMDPARRHPARPILCVSTAVFRDGRVLLGERVKPPGAGRFSLPGGVVEVGETLEAAALRELMEETGVVATIGGFAAHTEVLGRDADGAVERHFVVVSFWGEWASGEAVPREDTASIRWAEPDDLARLPLTPGLEGVIAKAVAARRRAGTAP